MGTSGQTQKAVSYGERWAKIESPMPESNADSMPVKFEDRP